MHNKIRELRQANGLTQEELANKVCVSRQTIISLETGRYDPSIHLAFRIAQTFQKPIEEVFAFDKDGEPQC